MPPRLLPGDFARPNGVMFLFPSTFPFGCTVESFYVDSCDRALLSVPTRFVFEQAPRMVQIPRLMLLGGDF